MSKALLKQELIEMLETLPDNAIITIRNDHGLFDPITYLRKTRVKRTDDPEKFGMFSDLIVGVPDNHILNIYVMEITEKGKPQFIVMENDHPDSFVFSNKDRATKRCKNLQEIHDTHTEKYGNPKIFCRVVELSKGDD